MKYALQINQAVIFENGWHKNSDLTTWALFDFLCFFNNADGHRTLNDGEFKWINYKYIIESLPLCDFYNQKIKKHLDILASFGIIALEKDSSNNIYFKLLPKHRILFEKSYNPRENFTDPLVKNYQPPRENFTHNNNKESISKNNDNNFTPYIPQRESKGESDPRLEVIKESFQKTKELYKQVKPSANDLIFQKAEQEFFRIVRDCVCRAPEIVEAMRKQVELWDHKLKEDAKAIQYIPRLENWLERRAFFEDFDKLLEPYKSKGNQQARGGVGYGDPQAQDGYLIDILKK